MEHRNWHYSRAMEINLNIIIDDTLVRNIKVLKHFYNWEYNIETEILQKG